MSGDDVCGGMNLPDLFGKEKVVITKIRSNHVPVEILGLRVQGIHIGQQGIEGHRQTLAGHWPQICGRGEPPVHFLLLGVFVTLGMMAVVRSVLLDEKVALLPNRTLPWRFSVATSSFLSLIVVTAVPIRK